MADDLAKAYSVGLRDGRKEAADRIEELEAALKWISEYNDDIPAEPPTEIGEESKKLWVALIICTCRAKYALKEKKDD